MPMWIIPALIAFALLSFVMAPPTFIVNWLMAKFSVHTKVSMNSKIYVNDAEMLGDQKERFIQNWNDANFLYQYYGQSPETNDPHYVIEISAYGTDMRFTLFIHDKYIDVVKDVPGKKRIVYRVEAPGLRNYVASGTQSPAT